MSVSTSICGLLACGWDGILIVDESSAGNVVDDASHFVLGRLFTRDDHRSLWRLEQTLEDARAERWHASSSGCPDLFSSDALTRVLDALRDLSDSYHVDLRQAPSELASFEEVEEGLRESEKIQRIWPKGKKLTFEVRLMFSYLGLAPQKISQLPVPPSSLLIIVDRLDYIQGALNGGMKCVPIWQAREAKRAGYRIEARTLIDKNAPTVAPIARMLALVDSELWASRRLPALSGRGGRRLDHEFREWAHHGFRSEDSPIDSKVRDRIEQSQGLSAYLEYLIAIEKAGRCLHINGSSSEQVGHGV